MDNGNQDIEVVELVAKLWKARRKLIIWCVAGALIGLVAAFSIPKSYRVKAKIAPEMQVRVGSGVSSIASMMGVSLDNSRDAIDVEMYPDVVSSTPFLYDLLDLQIATKDNSIQTTLSDYVLNHQKKPWWSHVLGFPFKALGWVMDLVSPDSGEDEELDEKDDAFKDTEVMNLTKDERKVIKFLSKGINVMVDKKTAMTELSMSMQDPYVAATVMNAVLENLKTYMAEYRTSKARQDVENLALICEERKQEYHEAQRIYAECVDANSNVVKSSAKAELQTLQQEMNLAFQVYSQVATQLEGARIKEQQEKPVFAVLEPVTVPIRKSAPSKVRYLVVFAFLATCCAACWVLFGKELWAEVKETSNKV